MESSFKKNGSRIQWDIFQASRRLPLHQWMRKPFPGTLAALRLPPSNPTFWSKFEISFAAWLKKIVFMHVYSQIHQWTTKTCYIQTRAMHSISLVEVSTFGSFPAWIQFLAGLGSGRNCFDWGVSFLLRVIWFEEKCEPWRRPHSWLRKCSHFISRYFLNILRAN